MKPQIITTITKKINFLVYVRVIDKRCHLIYIFKIAYILFTIMETSLPKKTRK